jgi:hypothetical protein
MDTKEYKELILLEKDALHSSYEQGDFTAVPTKLTRFIRTFLPWQIARFFWINVRMMIMIFKSHQ